MKRISFIALASVLLIAGVALVLREQFLVPGQASSTSAADAAPEGSIAQAVLKPQRPSPVPDLLATLSDLSLHRTRYIAAIRSLPDDLTTPEFQELMNFIRQPLPDRWSASSWYVIVNEIMGVLGQSRFSFEGYRDSMLALMLDGERDLVVRDYAAQYLALSFDNPSFVKSMPEFQRAMESYLELLDNDSDAFNDVTGTSLMSLANLASHLPDGSFDDYWERLGAVLVRMVSGERKASFSNRISAIQAAGRIGFPEALPAIRALALDESANPSFRLSAVAALGYFGLQEDRDFLAQLAAGDSSLVPAARTALEAITKSSLSK